MSDDRKVQVNVKATLVFLDAEGKPQEKRGYDLTRDTTRGDLLSGS